jgi:hypothetical protein
MLQCCGSGSGAFLTPGYGIRDGKKSRSRIRDEHSDPEFGMNTPNNLLTVFGLSRYQENGSSKTSSTCTSLNFFLISSIPVLHFSHCKNVKIIRELKKFGSIFEEKKPEFWSSDPDTRVQFLNF